MSEFTQHGTGGDVNSTADLRAYLKVAFISTGTITSMLQMLHIQEFVHMFTRPLQWVFYNCLVK
jgi:hypothetical protein